MTTIQEEPEDGKFWKIRVERIADKVETQLRQLIVDGTLKVGERLPSERELAERMGVSRVSVRQAIQRLELQGILETVHGGGLHHPEHHRAGDPAAHRTLYPGG